MAGSMESPFGFGRSGRVAGEPSSGHARHRPPVSSQRQEQLFSNGPHNSVEVFRTPVLNVASTVKIADSIQP